MQQRRLRRQIGLGVAERIDERCRHDARRDEKKSGALGHRPFPFQMAATQQREAEQERVDPAGSRFGGGDAAFGNQREERDGKARIDDDRGDGEAHRRPGILARIKARLQRLISTKPGRPSP